MSQEQIMYLIQTINDLKNEMSVMKQEIHENKLLATISNTVLSQEERQNAYTEYMQIQQRKMEEAEIARQFK